MGQDKNVVKIKIELDPLEYGVAAETPFTERVGKHHYKLLNTPFFACNLSFGDIVEARINPDHGSPFPVFKRIISKSGHRTIGVVFGVDVEKGSSEMDLLQQIQDAGCDPVFCNAYCITIDVPSKVDIDQITRLLDDSNLEFDWSIRDPFTAPAKADQS